ncbi:MAG: DUF433 domain-containing protein [Tepidiformaceae bacterium]
MSAAAQVSIATLLVSRPGYRDGRPCLKGTGLTVHSVAVAYSLGVSVEDMCAENPDLDPSLFHAALAHYFANRAQIDAELEEDRRYGEGLAARYPNGITRDTLELS